MKRIIRNISLCVLLALVMGACEEDAALVAPNVAHDKSTVSPEEVGEAAFLQSASESGNKFIFLDFVEQGSDELYVELVEPAERDMTFTIGINTSLVLQDIPSITEQFYKVGANFVEDWENKFTITNGGKVTVAAGERKSTRVSFTVSNMELIGSIYCHCWRRMKMVISTSFSIISAKWKWNVRTGRINRIQWWRILILK